MFYKTVKGQLLKDRIYCNNNKWIRLGNDTHNVKKGYFLLKRHKIAGYTIVKTLKTSGSL